MAGGCAAASALSNPWRTLLQRALDFNAHLKHSTFFQLATVGGGGRPANRTVVFRGFQEHCDKIQINTDGRTNKIGEIKNCPFGEICWYFTDTWEQFRISGSIDVIDGSSPDPAKLQQREKAWFASSVKSRLQYLGPCPGIPVADNDLVKDAYLDPSAGPVDTFCLLVLDPEKVDYLNLKSNQRLMFTRRKMGPKIGWLKKLAHEGSIECHYKFIRGFFMDFFRCQDGHEARADAVATKCCKKLVVDMHYEARIQAVVTYHGTVLGTKVTKRDVRTMTLTRDQYLQMIPYWCAAHPQCWEQMVHKWCSREWEETHNLCRERRLMMPGVAHHQDSRNLSGYAETWSASHGGQPCSIFKAFAMAHKGKATSDVDYNPEDGPEVYSNATVHNRLSEYTSMAREVHGPEYDPSTEDLDGEVVMRVGGGKKHGRYWIGDGAIDSAATPSLSQIRASSTSTSPAIRPRQDTSHHRVGALEAQLEQERRIREQMHAKMERVEAEREAEQRRMAEILQYMQSLGAATGVAPPPSLFAPPPPPYYSTPNQSAGSNDPHASVNPSPNQSHWPSW